MFHDCYDLSYKNLPLVKNHVVGTQQHHLKAKSSDCVCPVLSSPKFDRLITENLKFHFYLSFYLAVKRLQQYMLFKFPLQESHLEPILHKVQSADQQVIFSDRTDYLRQTRFSKFTPTTFSNSNPALIQPFILQETGSHVYLNAHS